MAEVRTRIERLRCRSFRGRTKAARYDTVNRCVGADHQRAANTMPISNKAMIAPPERLITRRELCQMVPYTPQHILRLEKQGKFPRRIHVGANRVAWLLSEVQAWIAARAAERDTSIR